MGLKALADTQASFLRDDELLLVKQRVTQLEAQVALQRAIEEQEAI